MRVVLLLVLLAVSCVGVVSGGEDGGASPTGGGTSTGGGGVSTGGGAASGGGVSAGGGSSTGGGTSTGGGNATGGSSGSLITPGAPGSADVQFVVHTDLDRHAISPLIYGSNVTSDLASSRNPVIRMGGNRLTAWNWENNASNAGSDYLFQNDGLLETSNTPGQAVTDLVNQTSSAQAALVLTVPIVDYVAADKNGGGDVRNSGSNYLSTRFRQNRATKGAALSLTPDATDAYVNQDEFVNWVKNAWPSLRVIYSLDNEPDLWSATHAEVHPIAVGYVELVTRNITFATMIKSVAPSAEVCGPASYGWGGYVDLQSAPDAAGKGEFLDYYLSKVHQAATTAGHRLVDYLDLHWYPEATGGGQRVTGTQTDAATVAARVQAPRSLWDPTYVESSWIESTIANQPIALIPRMREKIAANDPGMRLAFTEWNYGAGQDISGAVATADVLGVFGREAVGLATNWPLASNESYTYAAFRAFRNYDGAGGAFGDTSVQATTSDLPTATIYGSVDAASGRPVIVLINKSTSSRTGGIALWATSSYTKLKVYTVTSGGAQVKPQADVAAVATNAFHYAMPAMSISVLVPTP